MIISHKYKFIFIKTRKTAVTIIESFLSNQCGEHDIITLIYPPIDTRFPKNYQGYFNPIGEFVDSNFKTIKITFADFYKKRKFYNHIPAYIVRNGIGLKVWNNYFKFCVERNP